MRDSSLTAETMTHWMRSSGTLPRGTVDGVHVELEHETPISKLIFFTATYSSDAPELPRCLLIKSPLNTPALNDVSSEMQFYRRLAPILGTPPAVRCLATIEDTNS